MHYERSIVWKKSMRLAEEACRHASSLPREERFGMRSQMTRAAVSIPSNIAEGWSRETQKDKANFLAIAQGSLAEFNTQLLLCRQLGWLEEGPTQTMLDLIDEVSRMLTTLRQRFRQATRPMPAASTPRPPSDN
jgi:four helix bundle protein